MCYKGFILLVENKVYSYMRAATVEYFGVPRPSQHLSSHCSLMTPVLKGFPFYTKDMEEHSSLVQLNSLPQAMQLTCTHITYRVPALTPPQAIGLGPSIPIHKGDRRENTRIPLQPGDSRASSVLSTASERCFSSGPSSKGISQICQPRISVGGEPGVVAPQGRRQWSSGSAEASSLGGCGLSRGPSSPGDGRSEGLRVHSCPQCSCSGGGVAH